MNFNDTQNFFLEKKFCVSLRYEIFFSAMENDRSSEVFVGVGERAVLECGPSLTLRGKSSSSMAEEVLTWNKKEDTGTQLIDW